MLQSRKIFKYRIWHKLLAGTAKAVYHAWLLCETDTTEAETIGPSVALRPVGLEGHDRYASRQKDFSLFKHRKSLNKL